MEAQDIFNTVVLALRKQGKRSVNDLYACLYRGPDDLYACLYRGPDGLKCAVGHLIPDEEYLPKMEGRNISELLFNGFLTEETKNAMLPHLDLLESLQKSHDFQDPASWEAAWKNISIEFGLKLPPIEATGA